MNDLMELFKEGNLVVECRDEEKYLKFMEKCNEHSLYWCLLSDAKTLEYDECDCCIRYDGKHLVHSTKNWYQEKGYQIITFE